MTYSTLMVHLDLGVSNEGPLRVAAELARRIRSARHRHCGLPADVDLLRRWLHVARVSLSRIATRSRRRPRETEAAFHAALAGTVPQLEWRSASTSLVLADYLADQARAAAPDHYRPRQRAIQTRSFPAVEHRRTGHARRAARACRPTDRGRS